MAIPGILLAITLVRYGADRWNGHFGDHVTEIPRVVRLVRSLVLSIRDEPYVEAAIFGRNARSQTSLSPHLAEDVAPLIVQGTYICAFAMLVEAILSFLGVGLPSEVPTWATSWPRPAAVQ
jgi:peptide/nickel transport system permease protein